MTPQRWIFVLLTVMSIGLAGFVSSPAAEVKLGTPAPDFTGGPWINSGPISITGLRGKVALIEFWTYG